MPSENDPKWPMPRETVVFLVEDAKSRPTYQDALHVMRTLDKAFRGVYNKEAFALIDSIESHFKQEWLQEKRRQGDAETYPALDLLQRLVRDGKRPKDILMPYRAAIEASVLLPPMPSVEDFNGRFGTNLSAVNYSTYITSGDNRYKNARDEKRFRMLVMQFKNTQNNMTEK